tara:strand:- start:252 stop:545 length:294 start_codon:yes stop_codon:yes gene_type:complete
MINKVIITLSLIFFVSACTGIGNKRSDKSDEFLIEKKNPLVMPPDIDELPKPKESAEVKISDNNFEETLKTKNSETQKINVENSSTLQESIIKKIEQ